MKLNVHMTYDVMWPWKVKVKTRNIWGWLTPFQKFQEVTIKVKCADTNCDIPVNILPISTAWKCCPAKKCHVLVTCIVKGMMFRPQSQHIA